MFEQPQLASVVIQGAGGTLGGSPTNAAGRESSPSHAPLRHGYPVAFPGMLAAPGAPLQHVNSAPHLGRRCTPRSARALSPPGTVEHLTKSHGPGAALLASMLGSMGAPVAPLRPTSMSPPRPAGTTHPPAILPPAMNFVVQKTMLQGQTMRDSERAVPKLGSFVYAPPAPETIEAANTARSASTTDLTARSSVQRALSGTRGPDMPGMTPPTPMSRWPNGQLAPPPAGMSGRSGSVHHDGSRAGSPIGAGRLWVTPPQLSCWFPQGAPPQLSGANTPPASLVANLGLSAHGGMVRPPASNLPVSTPPLVAGRDRQAPTPEFRPPSVRPRSRPPAKASNRMRS